MIRAESRVEALYVLSYTYIVDSDDKLADWANNDRSKGQDYTSVLIRKGTWSSVKGISLGDTGTKLVVGEVGSLLNFDVGGEALRYADKDLTCSMFGVNVKMMDSNSGGAAFYRCTNLTNCTVDYTCSGISTGSSFLDCENLTNCTATSFITSEIMGFAFSYCLNLTNCKGLAISASRSSVYGFSNCTYLFNCEGAGVASTRFSGQGHGFDNCFNVICCRAFGQSTTKVFNRCYSIHTASSSYACGGTANGGFNDPTNT